MNVGRARVITWDEEGIFIGAMIAAHPLPTPFVKRILLDTPAIRDPTRRLACAGPTRRSASRTNLRHTVDSSGVRGIARLARGSSSPDGLHGVPRRPPTTRHLRALPVQPPGVVILLVGRWLL